MIFLEQKIKQDATGNIGRNIRRIRKSKGLGQTELVRSLAQMGKFDECVLIFSSDIAQGGGKNE